MTAGVSRAKHIHFIGIGGVGMSGIALVASKRGMVVTGSDLKESRVFRALTAAGIPVRIGHNAQTIDEVSPDIVVVSSAIPANNPELIAAQNKGIEIWPRAKMLAHLGEGKKTLAVAGTHGKTTTSSMLATSLYRMGLNPTFLIGGTVDGFDTNAVAGSGDYFVVEADESDGSFTFLSPYIALVTNIEEDHLDHYADIHEIEAAFVDFMASYGSEGAIVICGDNPSLPKLARTTGRTVISYGFSDDCDVRCIFDKQEGLKSLFSVILPDGTETSLCLCANPGIHNVLNATGVMAALWFMGFDPNLSASALSEFTGVRRRFDFVGRAFDVDIVDDYGHHPTEVMATIQAARLLGYRHVHVLFQPHRYTRTEALAAKWGEAFDQADSVTFMDVYSAGEIPIPGVTGKTLVDAVLSYNPRSIVGWMPHRDEIVSFLSSRLKPGDLLLTMGAGDITTMGPLIVDELARKEEAQ